MCGGAGDRLDADREKPLVEIGGRTLIDRVRGALAADLETVYAVTAPRTPATRAHVDGPVIDAPGEGYVADLSYALDRVDRPVVTATADLPFLDGDHVRALRQAADGSAAVAVPLDLKRALGYSVDRTYRVAGRRVVPTGLGLVAEDDPDWLVSSDPDLAAEIDRPGDRRLAEGTA